MAQLGVHARQRATLRKMHTQKKSVSEVCNALDLMESTVQSFFDLWDEEEKALRGGGSRRKPKQETIPAKDEFS